jgi:hypothetical protein
LKTLSLSFEDVPSRLDSWLDPHAVAQPSSFFPIYFA